MTFLLVREETHEHSWGRGHHWVQGCWETECGEAEEPVESTVECSTVFVTVAQVASGTASPCLWNSSRYNAASER